ncbi:MAG: urea carboxylase-associated family protein [Betaproteobacteria bacterium]|nr:urea carboxylase-associated family protein [Betaproteobacteria bacterium]
MQDRHLIPARKGAAARIKEGQILRVTNTHGSQVVDFWAFNDPDLGECMSMEHSRPWFGKIIPGVGDTLLTNKRRPILTVIEDTSPGVHDTLIASCDTYRYEQLGCKGFHDNCTDNLGNALQAMGLKRVVHPCPFNLFMHIPVKNGLTISFEPPVGKAGDSISFRAEMDAVVGFSACPQDMVPINGTDGLIHDAHYEII